MVAVFARLAVAFCWISMDSPERRITAGPSGKAVEAHRGSRWPLKKRSMLARKGRKSKRARRAEEQKPKPRSPSLQRAQGLIRAADSGFGRIARRGQQAQKFGCLRLSICQAPLLANLLVDCDAAKRPFFVRFTLCTAPKHPQKLFVKLQVAEWLVRWAAFGRASSSNRKINPSAACFLFLSFRPAQLTILRAQKPML